MLALLRRIPELERDMRSGGWNRTGRYAPRQLAGTTVGLVGCGAIGRLVAQRLAGFGVQLLIHDPALGDSSTPLDDLLRQSAVVSLHCPLLPSTRHLINADALRLMRPDAVLVNAARGALVDGAALIEALQTGVIAGAALDVFELEPPGDVPLLSMDNVVVSPHVAGLSTVSVAEMTRRATAAVLDVVAGRPVEHLVNHQALGGNSMTTTLATGPVTWGVDFADTPTNPPWQQVLDDIVESGLPAHGARPGRLPAGGPRARCARCWPSRNLTVGRLVPLRRPP